MKERIFLLDGHSLAHRAFYALPLLTNSSGEYTNSVFGFARMLFKLIDDENPEYLAVAFDKKAPTFRHKEYEEYKSTRKKMPEELSPQIDLIKEMLDLLGIPIFEIDGYEADDVIGTLAREGESEGLEVIIVTGDRDALQLVTDDIKVMYTKKGITDIVDYNLDKVREKYELEPQQLIDKKGLMGDSSDNIPGVPGIGPKTATMLLKEFSTLENVLDNIDKVSGKKRKENLHKYSEQARMSKMLGEIITDVPLDIEIDGCQMSEPDCQKIIKLFKRLEFSSLIDRFQKEEIVGEEDIELKGVTEEDDIKNLVEKLKGQEKIAFDFILDNYNRPVRAELKGIVVFAAGQGLFLLPGEKWVIELIKDILIDKKIGKYILHAKETMIILKEYEIDIAGEIHDSLLAYYLLNPSQSLLTREELLKQELNIEIAEDVKEPERTGYLVFNLFQMSEDLLQKLKKMNLFELYHDIEVPLINILAEMEYNGIKLDKGYLEKLSDRWQKKIKQIEDEVYKLAGEEFNLNSPKQLGEILFEKLGLPVIKKTKTGYSTGIKVLEELEDKHEIIPLVMEYRQWSKLVSTYVDALPPLINPRTSRLHTSFNQMVTATGRLSSTDPNLQNIPIRTSEGKEIRKAFIPENKDWTLLMADYSQVELRVLAEISGDRELKEAFRDGDDIHTETASKIFDVKAKEVTGEMRRMAKIVNFGIAYGMSAYGLSRDLGIPRNEAEEYIKRYFQRFSGVNKYMNDIKKKAKEDGYVTTIFDRRRYIPEIKSRNYHRRSFAERTAINTPIQGSAADIMKIAMIEVYRELKGKSSEARLLLQVHDELVLEVKKEYLEEVAELVKDKMENAVEISVPLIVDLQAGDNWRDKKDLEVDINA